MLKELLRLLYIKLESESENDRKNKTGNFDFFEEQILTQKRFDKYKDYMVKSKTMKNYYEKHVEGRINSSKEPTLQLKNLIAEYLGFDDYPDFESKKPNNGNFPKGTGKAINKKHFYIITSSIIVLLLVLSLSYKNVLFMDYNCIVWEKDHYTKAPCYYLNSIDNTTYHIDIDRFKKITLTKGMEFFTDGKENFWYGSNTKGEREFFTARGVHPETLKELDPITEYILEKEGFKP